MRLMRRTRIGLVSMTVLGLCLSTPGLAMSGTEAPSAITDIALRDGGALVGQVLNTQGVAKANMRVSLQDLTSHELAATTTDQQGKFTIQGLKGGVYQIVTPQGRGTYRVWMPGTAPPTAQQGALIVTGEDTVRGEGERSGLKYWLTNPLVIAGIVATAIAIPVAIHNSHHSSPSPVSP